MLDIEAKIATPFVLKLSGNHMQCMIPFPEFDEETFPLVLIKEWQIIVLFNIKTREQIKIADIDVSGEYGDGLSSN